MARKIFSNSSFYDLVVDYSYTQNIDNNSTTVTMVVKLKRTSYGTTSATHGNISVRLGIGNSYVNRSVYLNTSSIRSTTGAELTIGSYTRTFYHLSDGTYPDVRLSVYSDTNFFAVKSFNDSFLVSIATIPRASHPTTFHPTGTEMDGMVMGNDMVIKTNRKSSNFTHTIRYKFNDKVGTIASNVALEYRWAVPLLLEQVPNEQSSPLTIYLDTYNGAKKVGTESKTVKLFIPSSVKPKVNSINIVSVNPSNIPSSYKANFIQNLSQVKITISASTHDSYSRLGYSTQPTWYEVKVDNKKYYGKTITSEVIERTNSSIQVRVRDSRGVWSEWFEQSQIFVQYEKPNINNLKVARSLSTGASNPSGTFARVSASLYGKHRSNVKVRIDDFSGYSKLVMDEAINAQTYNLNQVFSGVVSTKSYRVTVEFTDLYNQKAVQVMDIPTAQYSLAIGKEQVGIGMQPRFDKGVSLYTQGDIVDRENRNISKELDVRNITGSVAKKSGVEDLIVLQYGKVVQVIFGYTPSVVGFDYNVVSNLPKAYSFQAVTVSSYASSYDADANIVAYLTNEGAINIVTRKTDILKMLFSITYLTS